MFEMPTLSPDERTALLARIAHELTICARDTYEVGSDRVLQPQVLRAYNELLHRVTAALVQHQSGDYGFSVESIIDMARTFGEQHEKVHEIDSLLARALRRI